MIAGTRTISKPSSVPSGDIAKTRRTGRLFSSLKSPMLVRIRTYSVAKSPERTTRKVASPLALHLDCTLQLRI